MKKYFILIIVLSLSLSISTSAGYEWDIYDLFEYEHFSYLNGEVDFNVPIIEFTEEYFLDQDVEERLKKLFGESAYADVSVKHYSETEVYPSGPSTTYYSKATAFDGAFTLDREYDYSYGNHLVVYPSLSAREEIIIKEEAFEYMPESFLTYISSVGTLEKALDAYPHFEYSEEYFSEKESLALLCPIENVVYEYGEETQYLYYSENSGEWGVYSIEQFDGYAVFMQDPYTIHIEYTKNYFEPRPDNYNGLHITNIALNYSPTNGKLTSVEFGLSYYIPEFEFAPQTGFATAIYAAVAVVSAAAVVAVGKKRR